MMSHDFIIDVSESDFEYQVLAYSQQVPVVVDFWASWCAPCKVLEPVLEKLTHESQGAFRLARLNVDENPNISMRYQVRSIPAVKAFRDGKVVSEFIGVQPEPRIREFLRNLVPSENELLLEKGQSLIQIKEMNLAEATFRQVLESSPGDPAALLGLSRTLLYQGHAVESLEILDKFPPSREFSSAEKLRLLAIALSHVDDLHDLDQPLELARLMAESEGY